MPIFYFILLAFVLTFAYAGWRAAPWVPMRQRDVARILQLADIKPGQKFYELGCGDGRVVFAAAAAGAEAKGFEISLLPYCLAMFKKIFQKKSGRILFKDFWNCNLGDADAVFFFLTPKIMDKIRNKFERELKKGTKVICYAWPVDGWKPEKIDFIEGELKLYLYVI